MVGVHFAVHLRSYLNSLRLILNNPKAKRLEMEFGKLAKSVNFVVGVVFALFGHVAAELVQEQWRLMVQKEAECFTVTFSNTASMA